MLKNVDLLLEDVLEDVFEPSIIGLEDGVLCAHVQRPLLADGILEAAVCEACNRLEMARGSESHSLTSIVKQHCAD